VEFSRFGKYLIILFGASKPAPIRAYLAANCCIKITGLRLANVNVSNDKQEKCNVRNKILSIAQKYFNFIYADNKHNF
jgi:hypothetical protein